MGSPLSPLLAEIYMNSFEDSLFQSKNPLLNKIFYWFRYVDDILCCWTGTTRQLHSFLNFLNSRESSINFTLEVDTNKSINFLDLTITLQNNRHDFAIFRKPTHTDTIIPFDSTHPWSHKMAFFNCMINRLLTVPLSPQNFQTEVNTIKQIALNNSYPTSIVDKLIHKFQTNKIKKLLYNSTEINVPRRFFKLPFLPSISYKIKSLIPHNKYNVSFYTHTNLHKLLTNCKHHSPDQLKSGIYQLNCSDCNVIYIGKTGRNFYTRIHKEHYKYWQQKSMGKSNFVDHLLQHNHSFDPSSSSFLHFENNSTRLTHLEIFEIHKNSSRLCNEQLTFVADSPLLHLKFD